MMKHILASALWSATPPQAGEPARVEAPAVEPEAEPESELRFAPGVMVWLRGQARHAPDYTREGPAAVDALSRIRLQAELGWRAWSVFAQAQDHRAFGSRGESTASGAVGFHQGFVRLGAERPGKMSGFVRVGRQEIAWGRHRLLGTWPWAPQGRSFDAVQAQGQIGFVGLELMYAMMERPRTFTVEDEAAGTSASVHTRGAHLGGARLSVTPHRAFGAELMALVDLAAASPDALDRDRKLADIGGRVWGEPLDGVTYDVEAHGQLGSVDGLSHRAWAGASTLRARAPIDPVAPGLQLGYAIASGHACTGDAGAACAPEVHRDFFNFYPTNHPHYGILDQLGWSNMRDAEAGVFVRHEAGFEASATWHIFQLHDPRGRWRDSGGNLVGTGWDPDGAGATLGQEIDVLLTAELWAPVWLQPGYGVFLPMGAAARLAGPDPQHFVFLWVVVELPGKLAKKS
jgi:hypothetical protein